LVHITISFPRFTLSQNEAIKL